MANEIKDGDKVMFGPTLPDQSKIIVKVPENADSPMQVACIKKATEGQNLMNSGFTLEPDSTVKDVYTVQTLSTAKLGKGPVKINSEKFKNNWDQIFSSSKQKFEC